MKHQIEFDETELLALAKKQLVSDGIIPKEALIVHPSRSTEPDERGQYLFIYRWEAMDS